MPAKILEAEVNFRPHTHTSEEYQPTGFHFSLVSSPKEGRKQCHTWIKCRDFLQDATRNALTGRKDSIYGFSYDPEKDPEIDFRRTRIVVKKQPHPRDDKGRENFLQMMKSALDIVNHFESYAKWKPKTKLYKVKNDKEQFSFLFLGPGDWVSSSVGISMYTFLIRLGYFMITFKNRKELEQKFKEMATNTSTKDLQYLAIVHRYLYKIIDNYDLLKYKQGDKKILFGEHNIHDFHSRSGIVSVCQCNTPNSEINKKFKEILGK